MTEIKEVLLDWFTNSGFQVRGDMPEANRVQITAVKVKEIWRISLTRHSPLATKVEAGCFVNEEPDKTKLKEFWNHVSEYIKGSLSETGNLHQGIPITVLSQIESVVCIKAKRKNSTVQISGFFYNDENLIICTAHDLEAVKEIKVILYDGREITGHIVKKDLQRDLALVYVNIKQDSFIPLDKGRNLLSIGERLYSIGCTANYGRTVYSGVMDGLPRRVNNLLLWKVNMEIYPGSSGSPVFDVQGHLVAMVMGRYRGTDSVGFLIPLETIIDFVRE
ncbi:MAG: serine protease [Thermodesulfobacteriota bacterium]|nr:serine protease [Thermodesulfobacteriota bacterium]